MERPEEFIEKNNDVENLELKEERNEHFKKLMTGIELCLLPKLARNSQAGDHSKAYKEHETEFRKRFGIVMRLLSAVDLNSDTYTLENKIKLFANIIIFKYELHAKGPWCPDGRSDFAEILEKKFVANNGVSMDQFQSDNTLIRQMIFDSIIENLHSKLTVEDWNKYPAIVEVYSAFLMDVKKNYPDIAVNPEKVLKAANILLNEYDLKLKKRGMQICMAFIKQLTECDFRDPKYQTERLYKPVRKVIFDEDFEAHKMALDFMILLAGLFPKHDNITSGGKWETLDELSKDILDDIYIQTNLERKATSFGFLAKFLPISGIEFVRFKKNFIMVVCDNLELCVAENVRKIVLPSLMAALKSWLRYCWMVWRYETEEKLLSLLLKILYILCTDQASKKKLDDLEALIICAIMLCKPEQQETILTSLQQGVTIIDNVIFTERLTRIEQSVIEANTINTKKGKDKKKGKG